MRTRSSLLLTAFALLVPASCGDSEIDRPDGGGNVCPLNAAECASRGLNCGRVDLPDGTCFTCGICANGTETCGGGGQANICGCTPRGCQELGFECGSQDNGCGGSVECGQCLGGAACLGGICERVLGVEESCDRMPDACDSGLVCCELGAERVCLTADASGNCPAPAADLVLDRAVTQNSISFETRSFEPTSCAISDGCIPGPGTFKLMRFATQINNIGQTELRAGVPDRDPGFVYDMCHMHHHFDGFVNYALHERLPDGNPGAVVAGGFKFSYCIEDVSQTMPGLPGSPPNAAFTCTDSSRPQGLSVGWSDLYEATLDCQWVDITSVPAGSYVLSITANPVKKLMESRYSNNQLFLPVTVP